uniref:Uncharacterized protein n=1 Tax=uncultured gamma proteobacterium HF0010_16J05 TaxID=710981 RepID=E0XR47_9GAMM|nr:hypothetical protein [uncultured gamma proteobacterium HF0010_16J05]
MLRHDAKIIYSKRITCSHTNGLFVLCYNLFLFSKPLGFSISKPLGFSISKPFGFSIPQHLANFVKRRLTFRDWRLEKSENLSIKAT